MKARRVRLVTVVSGPAAVDVAVAADALVVHLVPVLGKALGLAEGLGARHTVWAWREQQWRPLQVNRTLEDAGVVDGEVLHLTAGSPDQDPPGQPTRDQPTGIRRPNSTARTDQTDRTDQEEQQ
ncbi:MAG: EsaB/YukD family protein [Motilibacteraceae bacterium]